MRRFVLLLGLLLCHTDDIATVSPAAPQDFAKVTGEAISQCSNKPERQIGKVSTILSGQETSKHIGEYVTVKFVVDNVHACRKGHVYLNETKDYKTCFAVIISSKARRDVAADMDKAYKGKTVSVTGKLEVYGGTPKIVLDKLDQLHVE